MEIGVGVTGGTTSICGANGPRSKQGGYNWGGDMNAPGANDVI